MNRRLIGKFFSMLIFIFAIPSLPSYAQYPSLSEDKMYDHLENPSSVDPVEHIILAGTPILLIQGNDHNVFEKFELCAIYAALKARKKDQLTIFLYGDPADEALKARVRKYEKLFLPGRQPKFILFKDKRELIDYLRKDRDPAVKIGSLTAFSHSWAFGLTIGEKDMLRNPDPPKADPEKLKHWYEDDPQHLYPENFRVYMPKEELEKIKRNLASCFTIFLTGCNTTLVTYYYKEPSDKKYYFRGPRGERRSNYIEETVNEPVAQAFANIFSARVMGINYSTAFQTIDEKTSQWRYLKEGEETPSGPLRMAGEKNKPYQIVSPDSLYSEGKKIMIKLIAMPYPLLTPEEMMGNEWYSLSDEYKKNLATQYSTNQAETGPLYEAYDRELGKLPPAVQKAYGEEMQERRKRIIEFQRKQKLYKEGKKDLQWLNMQKFLTEQKLHEKQISLGIPLTFLRARSK